MVPVNDAESQLTGAIEGIDSAAACDSDSFGISELQYQRLDIRLDPREEGNRGAREIGGEANGVTPIGLYELSKFRYEERVHYYAVPSMFVRT